MPAKQKRSKKVKEEDSLKDKYSALNPFDDIEDDEDNFDEYEDFDEYDDETLEENDMDSNPEGSLENFGLEEDLDATLGSLEDEFPESDYEEASGFDEDYDDEFSDDYVDEDYDPDDDGTFGFNDDDL